MVAAGRLLRFDFSARCGYNAPGGGVPSSDASERHWGEGNAVVATATLGERLTIVERELAELRERLASERPQKAVPWWEQRFGAFADSPEYEEADRLGREYRESLRPQEDADEVA